MRLSFFGSRKISKETEALHYSDTNFWEQTPQCLGDKLEIFLYFSNNKVCDSVPHFVWIHLRISRLLGLLLLKSTVFSPSQRFSTNNLLLGMLQVLGMLQDWFTCTWERNSKLLCFWINDTVSSGWRFP